MSSPELVVNIRATDNASRTMKQVGLNAKTLITGFAGLATSAFNLYNSYERVNDANLRVEKSQLAVKRATETLKDMEKRHNDALLESKTLANKVAEAQENLTDVQSDGTSTAEDIADAQQKLNDALKALDENKADIISAVGDIEIAEDNLKIKTEAAEDAQNKLRDTIIQGGIQAVPAIIGIIDKVLALKSAFDAAKVSAELATAASAASGVATATGVGAGAAGGVAGAAGVGAAATGGIMAGVGALALVGAYGAALGIQAQRQALNDYAMWATINKQKRPYTQLSAAEQQEFLEWIKKSNAEKFAEFNAAAKTTGGGRIPWKAGGGVFDKPTIIGVGEAGPEAVIPLEQSLPMGLTVNQTFNFMVDEWTDLSKVREAAREGANMGIAESLRRR